MSMMNPEIMRMMAATMGQPSAPPPDYYSQNVMGQTGLPGTLPRPTSNQAEMQPRPVGMQPRPAEMQPRPAPGMGKPPPDMSTLQGPSAPPPIPAGILAQLMGATMGGGERPGGKSEYYGHSQPPPQPMNVPKQGPPPMSPEMIMAIMSLMGQGSFGGASPSMRRR